MDIGVFRGLVTGVLLVLFIWLTVWTWSKRRQKAFDEAASLPLEDDGKTP